MNINTLIKILQDLPEEVKEAEILTRDQGSCVYQHITTEVTIKSESKIYENPGNWRDGNFVDININ